MDSLPAWWRTIKSLMVKQRLIGNPYLWDHPGMYVIAIATSIAGILYMVSAAAPELSLLGASLPHFVLFVFGFVLFMGGGMFARGLRINSPRLESAGAGVATWGHLMWAALVVQVSVPVAVLMGGIALAFALRSVTVASRAVDE